MRGPGLLARRTMPLAGAALPLAGVCPPTPPAAATPPRGKRVVQGRSGRQARPVHSCRRPGGRACLKADLSGRLVTVQEGLLGSAPGKTLSGQPTCEGQHGHGTFVGGVIAGDGAASSGAYSGVVPRANLLAVKVAGPDRSPRTYGRPGDGALWYGVWG
jgi:subtilisin family serine protease